MLREFDEILDDAPDRIWLDKRGKIEDNSRRITRFARAAIMLVNAEGTSGTGRKTTGFRGVFIASILALAASARPSLADQPQLISARNPLAALPVDYQNSVAPVVSEDGRYVLFVSSANTLVPGDNSQPGTDIFLRDRQTQTTILVSTNINGTGGGNGSSFNANFSADARYVLFESEATDLLPGSGNGMTNIFMRDLLTSSTVLVSAATNGGYGNKGSWAESMTPDGRFVVFISAASNLVAGDTNGIDDIFVRDTVIGLTTLVTPGGIGPMPTAVPAVATPAITPDGRFVAFNAGAGGLVPERPVGNTGGIYVRDLLASTTTWVSTPSHYDFYLQAPFGPPKMSDDGSSLVFYDQTGGPSRCIFRYELVTSNWSRITNAALEYVDYAEGLSSYDISADGRNVIYLWGQMPIPISTSYTAIRLWDTQTQADTVVSVDRFGTVPTNTCSQTATMTRDARFVAFLNYATNMVTNVTSTNLHLYLRDVQLGTNCLVDVDTNGAGSGDMAGASFSLSQDGRYVAFSCPDGALVAGDTNRALDIFLRDMSNGTTELISVRAAGVVSQTASGVSASSPVSLSADGLSLAFTSWAPDLVTNDFNNELDVLVRDLVGGTTTLVSVGTNGLAGQGGWSTSPVISSDGRYVAFLSAASNLVAGDTNGGVDVFLRDLQGGTTSMVNVDSNGVVLGNGDCSAPVISADGRYAAFLCKTNGFSGANTSLFWRDTASGQTLLIHTNSSTTVFPSLSADGRYVAYYVTAGLPAPLLLVWNSTTASNIYTNAAISITSLAISPTGTKLLFHTPGATTNRVFVTDFSTQSNLFSALSAVPIRTPAQWSGDGRFITFVTATNITSGDTNATNDVFLCDLQTGTLTLVSLNSNHTASANGASDVPVLSGNGRFLVFRSFATDITPGISNAPNLFLFDRLTGSNVLLTAESLATGWSPWVARPSVSSDGSIVAFQTFRAGFTPGDLNCVLDVFAEPQSPWSTADSDSDGIPDTWTMAWFGHPTGQAGDLSRAQDDADGDGLTNLQEYLTGTDPTSAASALRLQITATVSNNVVTLTWPTVPGKNFKVQYKLNADDVSWSELGGNVSVVGNQGSLVTSLTSPGRFYRVVGVQ